GILAPFEQRGRDRLAHRGGQRVQGFGAVERDAPHRALAADQDVACHGPPLQGEVAACKSRRKGSGSSGALGACTASLFARPCLLLLCHPELVSGPISPPPWSYRIRRCANGQVVGARGSATFLLMALRMRPMGPETSSG